MLGGFEVSGHAIGLYVFEIGLPPSTRRSVSNCLRPGRTNVKFRRRMLSCIGFMLQGHGPGGHLYIKSI